MVIGKQFCAFLHALLHCTTASTTQNAGTAVAAVSATVCTSTLMVSKPQHTHKPKNNLCKHAYNAASKFQLQHTCLGTCLAPWQHYRVNAPATTSSIKMPSPAVQCSAAVLAEQLSIMHQIRYMLRACKNLILALCAAQNEQLDVA